MVRAFIAIEVEEPSVLREIIRIRDEILSCSKGRGIKGVEDQNIHLTLRFLGEVPESIIPEVNKCIEKLTKYRQFTMEARGIGAFPKLSRPRVIWVGVGSGADILIDMRRELDQCLKGLVIRDRSTFVPHITIARIKGSFNLVCLANIIKQYENVSIGNSTVTKVVLKKSTLTPQGPIYTDLKIHRLRE